MCILKEANTCSEACQTIFPQTLQRHPLTPHHQSPSWPSIHRTPAHCCSWAKFGLGVLDINELIKKASA